jgi:hypothetical protein
VRLNGYFNTLVDINLCNGFNKELKNEEFVKTLDEWIRPKSEILSDMGFIE